MLVLSRKIRERIMIGDDIVITVTSIGSRSVRIGIDAPRSKNVVREEVLKPAVTTEHRSGGGDT